MRPNNKSSLHYYWFKTSPFQTNDRNIHNSFVDDIQIIKSHPTTTDRIIYHIQWCINKLIPQLNWRSLLNWFIHEMLPSSSYHHQLTLSLPSHPSFVPGIRSTRDSCPQLFTKRHRFKWQTHPQVMGSGDAEEALFYAINSLDGNETATINRNWVSPQQQNQMQQSGEGQTNGSYLPAHSIGLLVCIVAEGEAALQQELYGQCIEETFR